MLPVPSLIPFAADRPADFGMLVLACALVTLVSGLLIILGRRPLSRLMRARDDARAVQASHVGDPLRLGGVAIFAGLLAGAALADWQNAALPLLLILSAGPAFLAGLGEDLGFCVPPLRRLLAAAVSAGLAVLLLGVWVTRADLPGLDQVMAFAPAAVLLTVALSGGFCHSTNLVDGMHGLATTVILAAAVGLMLLAQDAGDRDLALVAAVLGAAMVGFLVLNWPFGTVFMGDAGSYGVGHVLIWIGILLAWRVPDIAIPALLLILFWPFADTFHSITRRLARRAPVFEPDRMHLHQKLRRCIEIVFLGGARRRLSNPLATLCLAPMIVMPVVAGVLLAGDARAAWASLVAFSVLFGVTNVLVTRFACARRRRFRPMSARLTHAE
ncbi:MraY family glycosyltransferase [Roseovarius tibetensis]|uniref:MraY family glycosyltransferase n=1 Tax=Roseovarius tibetensis TaxID=2685897 RepID=UPI003D7F455B